MITILNRLRQTLIFNLKSGDSLYLFSRKKAELTYENFMSSEIQSALNRGDIMILRMSEEAEKKLEKQDSK